MVALSTVNGGTKPRAGLQRVRLMYPSPPDYVFTHDRPSEVSINDIDEELRGTFELFSKVDGVHTLLMCQGHPESEELFAWSTNLEIRFVYHIDIINEIFAFKDELLEGVPEVYVDSEPTERIFHFVYGTFRRQSTEWKNIGTIGDEDSPWVGVNMRYNYETVGERRSFIRVLDATIKQHLING